MIEQVATMKLNADLGESYGNWQQDVDADVMPYIDQANIACGYHAGDAKTMQATLSLAKQYGVDIGAHPSYPDLQGFGRRSMRIPREDLVPIIHAQIATLEGMAKCQGLHVQYVKPHGALYNDMMKDTEVFEDIAVAIHEYHTKYPLMIQSLANNDRQIEVAEKYSVSLMYEAFADRRYTASGRLQSRQGVGAVLNAQQTLAQAKALIDSGTVTTNSGEQIHLKINSLCVHGDNPEALSVVKKIRMLLSD